MLLGGGAAALLATQYDMNGKLITYTTPESVREIIDAKGDGFGIMNTENGLLVNGGLYPKGTVFEIRDGMVESEGSPIFGIIDFLVAAGFEQVSKRFFRRGDTDIRLTGNESAEVTIYEKGNDTALRLSVSAVLVDEVAKD